MTASVTVITDKFDYLNGDVPLQFVLEANGLHAGNSLHDGRLAVSDVTDRPYVDSGLPTYDLRCQCRQARGVDSGSVLGHKFDHDQEMSKA